MSLTMDVSEIIKSSAKTEADYKFPYQIINDDWLANIDIPTNCGNSLIQRT